MPSPPCSPSSLFGRCACASRRRPVRSANPCPRPDEACGLNDRSQGRAFRPESAAGHRERRMDFEYSDRTKALLEKLHKFMDEVIYPAEPVYEEQMEKAKDR